MATRKRKKKLERSHWWDHFGQADSALPVNALLGFLLLVTVAAGVYYGWRTWGRSALARLNHRVDVENLQVTPQPTWIGGNIVNQVYDDSSLAELSLLDEELTLKVYGAFEMHPWVAKVDRVGKRPGGALVVDLHYRQPIAKVEIPADMTSNNRESVLPIDADAVLLPTIHLRNQLDALPLLRIWVSQNLAPWPNDAGETWRDARVAGAARIASLLAEQWQEFGLYRIRAYSIDTDNDQEGLFQLETGEGELIVWGSAPGKEQPNEQLAAEKLQSLHHHFSQRVRSEPGMMLDLRLAAGQQVKSTTTR